MIEFLLHAPNRTIFLAVMQALQNPLTGEPLASIDEETGALVPSPDVRIDEVGTVWKTEPEYDEDGNETVAGVSVPGHHVNLIAVGALAKALTAGMPNEGDILTTTRILSLLGSMEWKPITAEGVPEGYEGTSGVRIFDPAAVSRRTRVWA